MPAGAPADLLLVPGAVRDAARAAGTDKAAAGAEALLDEAMECFPALLDPGWIWLMDRNYHGAPRIARMIQSHARADQAQERHPAEADLARSCPDGSYRAELSGDGVTVKVRVIEYWVTVEGQEVPEMFCLVTDLMDWDDYPAPELAALYRRRWDGSETALREAKAPLRGAGPGTGPMLRSGSPDLVRQELAAWAAGTGMTRGVVLDAAARRRARAEGAPCRARWSGPGTCPSPAHVRAVLSAIRLGHDCYQTVTSEIGQYRTVVDRDRHRARKSKSPSSFAHAGRGGHRHPHRPRRHHHGQHPSLTSSNTGHPPGREPAGPWTRPPGATRRPPACPPEGNYPQ